MSEPVILAPSILAQLQGSPERGAVRDAATGLDVRMADLLVRSERVAAGMSSLGIQRHDRVLVFAAGSVDWVVVDLALQRVGAVPVLVDPEARSETLVRVGNSAGVTAALVDGPHRLFLLLSVRKRLPALRPVVLLTSDSERASLALGIDPGVPDAIGLGPLELLGAEAMNRGTVPPTEATTVFEPGTSPAPIGAIGVSDGVDGEPRLVAWTPDALAAHTDSVVALAFGPADLVRIDISPSTILGRTVLYRALLDGATVAFQPHSGQAAADTRPTFWLATPRELEALYGKLVLEAAFAGGLPLRLFRWARRVGDEVSYVREGRREADPGLRFMHRVADYAVGRKLRARLGGRLTRILCAQGTLSPRIARFFHGIGIDVQQSYGCIDAAPIAHFGRFGTVRFGVIGLRSPGVDARVVNGGLELRAPRYAPVTLSDSPAGSGRTSPNGAPLPIDSGWIQTGDAAEIDGEGVLKRTERRSGMLDVSAGRLTTLSTLPGDSAHRTVLASTIECELTASPYVSRAVVVGSGRPHLIALLTLDQDALAAFARERRIPPLPGPVLAARPEVFALINGVVAAVNAERPSFESIWKFAVLEHELAVETGELTTSGRIRRSAVEMRHATLIESFYREQY